MLSLPIAALLALGSPAFETPPGFETPIEKARELAEARHWGEAAEVLAGFLRREPGDADSHGLYGDVLAKLGRKDEAAHHFDIALAFLDEKGFSGSKEWKSLKSRLARADSLTSSRQNLYRRMTRSLVEVAEMLVEEGHPERALDLLARLERVAPPESKERERLVTLMESVRAGFEEVQLDEAGALDELEGERELVEYESERYLLRCNLEQEVVELVAQTMDDIFEYYIQVYFDGDEKRISDRKATIRIHPNHARMMEEWVDPGRSVGGWWSPGEWRVVCYDTRTDVGTLDAMLRTLFHEASHQFMTMRSKGGRAPAWLNEGTSSFFEGATAMADHRVLWPDAAGGRLLNLASMLRSKRGPTVRQVVEYDEPESYPGDHYPFGWGLIYYLQQYEDPDTLEYVWRPYYLRYLDHVTTRGGSSMPLFEEIVLERGNPGGFGDFDEFAASWESWILDTVEPLHFGNDVLERRRAELERYVAAADGDRETSVPEEELLLRALGHAEYLRAATDEGEPDLEVMLTQAGILERLERAGSAAAMLELILGYADGGRIELEPERYAELDERMSALDRGNYPLRTMRARTRGFARNAASLLAKYEKKHDMLLRGWSFAREVGAALEDDVHLLPAAERLRLEAREAGLFPSRILRVEGDNWVSIFDQPPAVVETGPGQVVVEMPARPNGVICTDIVVEGEYEVRCQLVRESDTYRSSGYGVVVSGVPDGVWIVVGIGSRDRLVITGCYHKKGSGTLTKTIRSFDLTPAIGPDEEPELAVRVHPDGRLTIRVGERKPLEYELPVALPSKSYVGAFVKDGRVSLLDFQVEVFP
ncbi:MAG: hypothetical protein O7B99_02455 [Planctomycetota bacterium]|nr:hypothetical protein [Planctomycetota bacterium]